MVVQNVKIWDIETGQCTNTISNGAVSALAITADARRAFLGRAVGGSISVWDIESNRHIVDLEEHTSSISSIAVTPDGQKVVSASYDNTLRVWDTEASRCIGILEGHTAWISSVSITPDGGIAVSVSGDGTLRVWDLNSKKCLKVLQGHMTIINSVAVSVDGRVTVAGGHAGGIRVWNLLGSDASEELSKQNILKVDPSLNRIIFRASDESIRFLNSENNEGQKVLVSPEKKLVATYPFTVTSDFKLGISVHDGGRLSIWDMDNQRCLRVLGCGSDDISLIKTMPVKHQVLVIGEEKIIEVWDIVAGKHLRSYKIKEDFDARFLTITPDGREAVFADKENMIVFFDLETGDIPKVLCGHSKYIGNALVSHDGTRLISESFDKTLCVWDINNQDCVYAIKKKPGVKILAVGPDNRRLFFDDGFLVHIIDLDTGNHVNTLRGHTHFILSLLITPDSKFAITGSKDNTLRLWDTQESECLAVHLSDTGITEAGFVAWPYIIADTGTRNPAWIKIESAMSTGSPIVTGLRPWVFGNEDQQGHWERDLTAICYWCGQFFDVTESMLGEEISCPSKKCGKMLMISSFCCDRQRLY